MELEKQIKFAEKFRELHKKSKILILPNAWDPGSAVVFEKAGFEAIGTTSAGIAFSWGYSDGQNMALEDLIYIVNKMTQRINIPLTIDIEAGYGSNVDEVVSSVRSVILEGAVGINLEDSFPNNKTELISMEEQCIRIRALVALKEELSIPYFINSRTDLFLQDIVKKEIRLSSTLERCESYIEAGADGIFIPGELTEGEINALIDSIDVPLNVLFQPKNPKIFDLEKLGVSRVSLGSGPARATLGLTEIIAKELFNDSTLTQMVDFAIPYDKANSIFENPDGQL